MRNGLLAALAGAATLMCASQAAAAVFTLDFTVSSDNWMQFGGTGNPFGLGVDPVLSGSLTGDTALLTSAPGPLGGAEMLTDFHFVAGSQTFTLADVDLAGSFVQIAGSDVLFGLGLGNYTGVSNNNAASLNDGTNFIACSGCVTNTRLTWTGLASPTPEPATWAMMLLGFLGLGAALRTRRDLSFN